MFDIPPFLTLFISRNSIDVVVCYVNNMFYLIRQIGIDARSQIVRKWKFSCSLLCSWFLLVDLSGSWGYDRRIDLLQKKLKIGIFQL